MARMLISDQRDFPELAKFVRLDLPEVRNKEPVWRAFLKFSHLNNFTAAQAIAWRDDSPLLRLADLGISNGEFDPKYPDWIFLHRDIATRFRSDCEDERARRCVEATLLHELVHWGDHRDGIDEAGEEGKAFEVEAYGEDVKRWWTGGAAPVATLNVHYEDLSAFTNHPRRGIRNHNPGNIRIGESWEGLARPNQMTSAQRLEKQFCVFVSPQFGVRAIGRLLLGYQTRGRLKTVAAMIRRWAPPSENDTQNYVAFVAGHMGIDQEEEFSLNQAPHARHMIESMIFMENGVQPYDDRIIVEGLELAELPP